MRPLNEYELLNFCHSAGAVIGWILSALFPSRLLLQPRQCGQTFNQISLTRVMHLINLTSLIQLTELMNLRNLRDRRTSQYRNVSEASNHTHYCHVSMSLISDIRASAKSRYRFNSSSPPSFTLIEMLGIRTFQLSKQKKREPILSLTENTKEPT